MKQQIPKHILVIRMSAMGDVAMTYPVLKSLLAAYPDTTLYVLSRPFFAPIFSDLPQVKFIGVDVNKNYRGVGGLIRLFRELNHLPIEAVADLHGVLRSHVLRALFFLSGKKVAVIDKGRAEKKALTRRSNKRFHPLKTTVERYADVFRKLGFDFAVQPLPRKPSPSTATRQRIGIAPFAQHASKQYPLALMREVVGDLSRDFEIFLFGGGEKEKQILDEWVTNEHIHNTVGQQSFADELALISDLDAMISMDSGNGHLAANAGVPVLTLWGLTHPYAGFAPFGSDKSHWLLPDRELYPAIPVSVYGNKTLPGYEAAPGSITPAEVVEKIKDIVATKNE